MDSQESPKMTTPDNSRVTRLLARHIAYARYEDLPADAVAAACWTGWAARLPAARYAPGSPRWKNRPTSVNY